MLYGYCRVSTKGQAKDGNSLTDQKQKLLEQGVPEYNIFIDSFTGTKMNRPELDKLLQALKSGDTLIVCKLDRFARSVSQASELITQLIDKGVTVNVLNLGILSNDSVNTVFCKHKIPNFAEKNGENCISVLEKTADCLAGVSMPCHDSIADIPFC